MNRGFRQLVCATDTVVHLAVCGVMLSIMSDHRNATEVQYSSSSGAVILACNNHGIHELLNTSLATPHVSRQEQSLHTQDGHKDARGTRALKRGRFAILYEYHWCWHHCDVSVCQMLRNNYYYCLYSFSYWYRDTEMARNCISSLGKNEAVPPYGESNSTPCGTCFVEYAMDMY